MKALVSSGFIVLLTASGILAEDWPGWRGPDRSGVSKEKGLLERWPSGGPRLAWSFKEAGGGYSTPAVVAGRVYCMGERSGTEYVYALDSDGKELWSAKIAPVFDFKTNSWSRGPNATPTVDREHVYALGSQGELVCVAAADGKVKWRKDLPRQLGARVNLVNGQDWGFSWSPLLDGDQLICTPGGTGGLFAALDRKSGEVLWRSKDVTDACTYSSPIAATLAGKRQYITLTQQGVVGVSAEDGELLWYYKREDPFPDVVCPTPICSEDQVYASAGWGGGAVLLKLAADGKKLKPEEVYSEQHIGNMHGGVVLVGGSLFGYHEKQAWECQDFATGKIRWSSRRGALKDGGLIYADRRLYCLSETVAGENRVGVVALLDASPRAYKEVSRFRLPEASQIRKVRGGLWAHPVISDGRLYVRDQELLFCYQIKGTSSD